MSQSAQINHMKAALVGVGLCAVIVTFSALAGGPERLVPYLSKPVTRVVGSVPTSGKAERAYRSLMEEANYHAAFALNDQGDFGWSDNHASQEAADIAALNWCADQGEHCKLVLQIFPATPMEIDGIPLSKTSALALADYPTRLGAKAVAVSNTGAWGMSWNRTTKIEALRGAMANCNKHLPIPQDGQEAVDVCRVVWAD